MDTPLIGRKKEIEILEKALRSPEAEMISVTGRRRIGKTYLIKKVLQENIVFELTGTKNAPLSEQLLNFSYALQLSSENALIVKPPSSWMEAFFLLINYLKKLPTDKKHVVFLDELPWLSTHKSGFLRALSFFWNSWAVNQNIIVVICGSAASWMIQKVVNDTGGLHNRITRRIQLQPFTLAETEAYFRSRQITLNRYHIIQLYMAMGGIPHYLKEVDGSKSAVQNIEDICFSPTGLLRDEFSNLYNALFEHSENHVNIVRALAKTKIGMERNALAKSTQIGNGGNLTKVLDELQVSGFIDSYFPYEKKKKDRLFRLTDEYSLFYLQFIEHNMRDKDEVWNRLSQTQEYKTWAGYAFENICLKHIAPIKKALSIGGVYSTSASFYQKGTAGQKGVQIDLLLDRNDQVINIFEIKFHNKPFVITKDYADVLRRKIQVFETLTGTRKHIFLTMIVANGLEQNAHSVGLVQQVLTLDDLFG